MKTLRHYCAAAILSLMLSLPAMAGDIPTWVVSPPPPPPPPASAMPTEPGDVSTNSTESSRLSESLVTEITVSLLQLLSVI